MKTTHVVQVTMANSIDQLPNDLAYQIERTIV